MLFVCGAFLLHCACALPLSTVFRLNKTKCQPISFQVLWRTSARVHVLLLYCAIEHNCCQMAQGPWKRDICSILFYPARYVVLIVTVVISFKMFNVAIATRYYFQVYGSGQQTRSFQYIRSV